ncbi:uncharacterized protein BX664DRAFT_338771 [Halteromyces radiatus]|uniref:uncharacterized protein n=1 Tax=Halteromyces radiatus TaxID=101107 RepID=UPI00221E8EC2|nr:uncharacterized protein BX664DRAFT_338771 [Halteromyces radiatus]KAI8085191.1 hypothetical protein BX664DRAFT_338771 [Halteromyces radiatus]
MRTLIGVVILAFWLGYLSATCGVFDLLVQVKQVLYIFCTIGAIYLMILIPLERIAEAEACKNPKSTFRTSAQEHLQRRGSF